MFRTAALAAALFVSATAANATTIVNGGFDTGAPGGSFVTAAPPGWTLTGGSVDHIGTYWQNQAGAGSVDLSGNGPGTLEQALATTIGQHYRVSFWIAGNTDGGSVVKSLTAAASGAGSANYTFDTTGFSRANMGWAQQFFDFVATSATTNLSFASNEQSAYGAALDSVSIAAVPEPATWGLLILGFGAVGGALRRRRTLAHA